MEEHPRVLLLAVDGSETGFSAARYGLRLAKKLGARVHIVHVIEYAGEPMAVSAGLSAWAVMLPAAQAEGRACVDRVAHEAAAQGVLHTEEVRDAGHAAEGILNGAADVKADLIVMGTHGRTGLKRAFMGSVAEKVVRAAACPVLTVR